MGGEHSSCRQHLSPARKFAIASARNVATLRYRATAIQPLTLEEFHHRYAGEKPYYEYWFGEAIQESGGTWLHGVLQRIIAELLSRAGYKGGRELELRIDHQWEPVPDIAGSLKSIHGRYSTEPLDVVVEILSPEDRMSRLVEKCRNYVRIGIPQIFVVDPEARLGWQWVDGILRAITEMSLNNGSAINLAEVWKRLAGEG